MRSRLLWSSDTFRRELHRCIDDEKWNFRKRWTWKERRQTKKLPPSLELIEEVIECEGLTVLLYYNLI